MLLHMGKDIINDNKILYDIKWDGWRILIHKQGERIEAYSRHGSNVTAKFPELQEVGRSIKAETAILDCEGVVLRNGNSVFNDFAYRGQLTSEQKINLATKTHPATFIAFDILQSENESHIKEPLIQRKERLSDIIKPSNSLQVTPSIIGDGNRIFELTKDRNMEGIVGKRIDSTYQINQRSYDWLKYKHFKVTNAVILGFKENPFTMIVGERSKNGQYRPIASVEFGFKQEERAAFHQICKEIKIKQEKEVTYIEPRLVCTVQYLERTEKGSLRIVSFKGFNFELTPDECYAL